jgi:hypothetical protein
MKFELSSAAKNAIIRGLIAGVISLTIYLLIVVLTTPNLSPTASLTAAFRTNWIIICGLSAGVGSQIYLSSYGKSFGCRISKQRNGFVGNSGSTAISSLFSFFSLVPLGCCGSWLLLLSFLPSLFGSTLSVILIQYAKPLSFLGLLVVVGYTAFTALRLKKELGKKTTMFETKSNILSGDY